MSLLFFFSFSLLLTLKLDVSLMAPMAAVLADDFSEIGLRMGISFTLAGTKFHDLSSHTFRLTVATNRRRRFDWNPNRGRHFDAGIPLGPRC